MRNKKRSHKSVVLENNLKIIWLAVPMSFFQMFIKKRFDIYLFSVILSFRDSQTLHYPYCSYGVTNLSDLALEFLHITLNWWQLSSISFSQHPRMVHDVFCLDPFVHVDSEQLPYDILSFFRNIIPISWIKLYSSIENLFFEFVLVICLEWRISTKKDVEDDSNCPPIDFLSIFFPT